MYDQSQPAFPSYEQLLRMAQPQQQPSVQTPPLFPSSQPPIIDPSNRSANQVQNGGIASLPQQQQQSQQSPQQQQQQSTTNGPMLPWEAVMQPAMAIGALTRSPLIGAAAGAGLNLLYNYINKKYGG